MKRVLSVLFVVSMMVLVAASAGAAPKSPKKWDIIAPVPNSKVDFYESHTGQRNPFEGLEILDQVDLEWVPPTPGQRIFNSYTCIPYYYNQKDRSWSADIMQKQGYTIGGAGCALTSAAMVFRRFGTTMDPHQFNLAMGPCACPMVWLDLYQPFDAPSLAGEGRIRRDVREETQSPYIRQGWRYADKLPTSDWYNMAYAISLGYAPLLEVTRPNEKYHWVVVYQVNGHFLDPASYRIVDPNGGFERPLTDYTVGESCNLTSLVIFEPR